MNEKIRIARENKGFTQAELGERIGVSGKAVSAYESGRRSVSIDMLQSISAATGKKLSWFLGEEEEELFTSGEALDQLQIIHGQLCLSKTKSHRRRFVPIGEKVGAILERQKGRHDRLVFPSPGGTEWDIPNFRKRVWLPLFERAMLVDFVWHDFRHDFCSKLVMKGAPLTDVMKLAGHKTFEMTLRYAHLSPEHLRSTISLLD